MVILSAMAGVTNELQSLINEVDFKAPKEADLILAIGTRLGFNSTFYSFDNINKNAKIVQIELEKKMLGRYFPITYGACADAATATGQILKAIKAKKIKLDTKNGLIYL